MLITKIDLLPYLDDFSPERAEHCLRDLASKAPVFRLSSRRDEGLAAWIDWLHAELEQHRERLRNNQTLRPNIQRDGQLLHGEAPMRLRPVAAGDMRL